MTKNLRLTSKLRTRVALNDGRCNGHALQHSRKIMMFIDVHRIFEEM